LLQKGLNKGMPKYTARQCSWVDGEGKSGPWEHPQKVDPFDGHRSFYFLSSADCRYRLVLGPADKPRRDLRLLLYQWQFFRKWNWKWVREFTRSEIRSTIVRSGQPSEIWSTIVWSDQPSEIWSTIVWSDQPSWDPVNHREIRSTIMRSGQPSWDPINHREIRPTIVRKRCSDPFIGTTRFATEKCGTVRFCKLRWIGYDECSYQPMISIG